jgi:hypothetical protein
MKYKNSNLINLIVIIEKNTQVQVPGIKSEKLTTHVSTRKYINLKKILI